MDTRRIQAFAGALAAGLFLATDAAMAQPVPGSQGVLTDPAGKTLYTFDEDKDGKSSCYGFCAFGWPPYRAAEGAAPAGAYTLVTRDDGTKQWAANGKPLYRYVADFKAGDARGDGKDGTWHVAKPGS